MMEDFSGLALPPLFGGHILEAELEAAGVELVSGATEILESGGPPEDVRKDTREVDKRKYQALSKRVKELEHVFNRLSWNCITSVVELKRCARDGRDLGGV